MDHGSAYNSARRVTRVSKIRPNTRRYLVLVLCGGDGTGAGARLRVGGTPLHYRRKMTISWKRVELESFNRRRVHKLINDYRVISIDGYLYKYRFY